MFAYFLEHLKAVEYSLAAKELTISGTGSISQKGVRSKGFYSQITNVIINNGPDTIEHEAFRDCSELVRIYIPESVTQIINQPFWDCGKLKEIIVSDKSTEYYADSQHILYTKNKKVLIRAPMVETFVIDSSVTDINSYAFVGNHFQFGDIVFPKSVVHLCPVAFWDSWFRTISFEKGSQLKTLDEFNWARVDVLTIPKSVIKIVPQAFDSATIGEFIFEENSELKTIDISSFYNLKCAQITLPDGIETIKNDAFKGSSFSKISIGSKCSNISETAFTGCDKLTIIEISPDNTYYKSEGGVIMNREETIILFVPKNITEINIPNKIVKMGNTSLQTSSQLTTITIDNSPIWSQQDGVLYSKDFAYLIAVCGGRTSINVNANVLSICEYAAYYCTKLETVTFAGNSVTNIGSFAFTATPISTFTLPNFVKTIGVKAFELTYRMKTFNIDEENSALESAEQYSFSRSGISSFFVGKNVNFLGTAIFFVSEIEEIRFHPQAILTNLKNSAFELSTITHLVIPPSVTVIEGKCFAKCYNLETISYKGVCKLERIELEAFLECYNLKTVSLPESCVTINEKTFLGCRNLTSFSHKLTNINSEAFKDCVNLERFEFSEKQETLIVDAFFNCVKLVNFSVSEANTHYKEVDGTVYSKDAKTLILFPPGREMAIITPETSAFADNAFAWSPRIKYVAFKSGSNLKTIGESAFYECKQLRRIQMPANLSVIKRMSFYGCVSLKSIALPVSVKTIEEKAFSGCTLLKHVSYCGTNEINGENIFDNLVKVSVTMLYPSEQFCSNKVVRHLEIDCELTDKYLLTCETKRLQLPLLFVFAILIV